MSAMLKEIERLHYWDRAKNEIVETLMEWGQYPKNGRAAMKVSELVGQDFEFDSFYELWMQSRPETLWSEMQRIKDAAEVLIRDRLDAREHSLTIANLADDMERNAGADDE
jgi:hypothetical protein